MAAGGVGATSLLTDEEVVATGGVALTSTTSGKEVVIAGVRAGSGQATYVVTGATHIECSGS